MARMAKDLGPAAVAYAKTPEGRRMIAMIDGICGEIAPIIGDLRKRLAALEARPAMTYCGVWKSGPHQAGDCVTHGGHLWCCKRDTSTEPGSAPEDWQMALRKPRDGRDARAKWDRSASYRAGAVVLHRGKTWIAERDTTGEEPAETGCYAWVRSSAREA